MTQTPTKAAISSSVCSVASRISGGSPPGTTNALTSSSQQSSWPPLSHGGSIEFRTLEPDVILAGGAATGPLQQATRKIPIVFAAVVDPVGAGLVASLARPGGNTTGFTQFEYGISAKWLELLKQIAPRVMRVAVLRDPTIGAGIAQFAAMQSVAPSLGVELQPADVRGTDEIERAVKAFAGGSNGGLIITSSTLAIVHRELIITLAARHRLPAVYPSRLFITIGGLAAYGPEFDRPLPACGRLR